MTRLQLPITIRTPEYDEVPDVDAIRQKLEERKRANLTEGFTLNHNTTGDSPFTFYAEINVNNENLWPLFKALLLQFSGEFSFIYMHIDGEPAYSRHLNKEELLGKLAPYELELAKDGFLEFGVIYQDEKYLQEVYIKKVKYIQYWGMDEQLLRNTLSGFGIYEVKGLNFIDEYPVATEALRTHYPEAVETTDLLQRFGEIFV